VPSIDTLAQAYARKRKPPRRNFGVTGSIPGFGGVQQTQQAKKVAQANARYDRSVPRWQSSTGKQRAPYRPGERFKRKHPYKYGGGDASRAHRPRWN
jgi:hypothetical protein